MTTGKSTAAGRLSASANARASPASAVVLASNSVLARTGSGPRNATSRRSSDSSSQTSSVTKAITTIAPPSSRTLSSTAMASFWGSGIGLGGLYLARKIAQTPPVSVITAARIAATGACKSSPGETRSFSSRP
jgi:hypothetical protein